MAGHLTNLGLFCCKQWLANPRMDVMMVVLNDKLLVLGIEVLAVNNGFVQKLINTYRNSKSTYANNKSCLFLQEIAAKLEGGTVQHLCMATAGAVSNHWGALIVNRSEETLHYGDPMGFPPPPELLKVFNWWLEIPFLLDAKACVLERASVLVSAIKLLQIWDPSMTASSGSTQLYSSIASALRFYPVKPKPEKPVKVKGKNEKSKAVTKIVTGFLATLKLHSKNESKGRSNDIGPSREQKCFQKLRPDKYIYWCMGGCGKTFVNQNLAYTICHAQGCFAFSKEVWDAAKAYAASCAPSWVPAINYPESTRAGDKTNLNTKDANPPKKRKGSDNITRSLWCSLTMQRSLANKNTIRNLTLPRSSSFVFGADPFYVPALQSKLEEVHIIGQAEEIQALQVAYLKMQNNITVLFDGGTTKGREVFWTLHMLTAERKVYLMDVQEATSESHIAVWIRNFVLKVDCGPVPS
ncbi:hypothetical protein B0H34DRAFT_679943 [Crassisporium funariophilum]|nr:hypothetical protein B0H34DRAFT_679943 [Crassisporium funariophilum]